MCKSHFSLQKSLLVASICIARYQDRIVSYRLSRDKQDKCAVSGITVQVDIAGTRYPRLTCDPGMKYDDYDKANTTGRQR